MRSIILKPNNPTHKDAPKQDAATHRWLVRFTKGKFMQASMQRRWIVIIPVFAVLAVLALLALHPQTHTSFSTTPDIANARDFGAVSSDSGPDEWAMEGYNPARTRAQSQAVALPMTHQRVVTVPGDNGDGSPPSIARNLMLVEAPTSLRAVDLRSGVVRWDFPMQGLYVSPAVAGDRVFVRSEANNKGQILAIDLSTGARAWGFTPKEISSADTNYFGGHLTSPVVVNNSVFVGSGHALYALDANTGAVQWTYGTQDYVTSSATVANGRVYIADFKHVYAIDQRTGARLWAYTTASSVSFSPVVAGQTVLVTNGDTQVALDVTNGTERWTASFPGEGLIPGAVDNGLVYVKATKSAYALDLATGKERWRFQNIDFVSLPAVAGDRVFVVSGMGAQTVLQALNSATGQSVWQLPVPKLSTTAPVIAGQTIYVRTTDGRVLGFWH